MVAREFFVNKLRDQENEICGLPRPFGLKVGRGNASGFDAPSPGTRTRTMLAVKLLYTYDGHCRPAPQPTSRSFHCLDCFMLSSTNAPVIKRRHVDAIW